MVSRQFFIVCDIWVGMAGSSRHHVKKICFLLTFADISKINADISMPEIFLTII